MVRPVVYPAALVVAFSLLLLSATSGVSGEGNERLEEHRARLRRAVDELVSPDAGVRKDALYGVSRSLLRKGATEIQLLEPAEERLMATRAVAEAISLLAAAPGRASEPLPGSWYARRGLQAMTLYSDVTRQAYADRLADVLPLLDGLDRETRQRVYETFGDLGRLAEPAVPMLGELLKEPESALSAAGALAGIGGEQAKGHLRAAIKQESDKLRESAYHGWMYFATELTLADVQAVAAGLRDADPRVREAASRAFMHQRWQVRRSGLGADALSRLVMSAPLESPEEKVRRAACLLLGMLGEHGRRRADDLAKLLTSDPEKYARAEAATALARVDPSKPTVERLVGALEREQEDSVCLVLDKAIRLLAVHAGPVRSRILAQARHAKERGNDQLAGSLHYTSSLIPADAPR